MRILSTKQIRELDAYTIAHEPIVSIDLMERASRAFADWFILRIAPTKKIGVVCGLGNNGGDGLAVARMLNDWGYDVCVWVVRGGGVASQDFQVNYGRLPQTITRVDIKSEAELTSLGGCDVVIDALFGSGLSRPVDGLNARAIDAINACAALRIAIDIPSGLMADTHSAGSIVRADYTLSFQLPKLAFLLPESYAFTGEWAMLDIGLSRKFIKATPSPYSYTTKKDVAKLLKPRLKFDHKGTYGHALLIAGSYGKIGAAVLASRACVRAGVGLLTVHIPQCGYPIVQTAIPEAMAEVDSDGLIFSKAPDVTRYDTLGIGPGLGQDARTVNALAHTLENFAKPVVLDADALNMLGANRHLFNLVPPGSILTPHPKEFERLTGPWKDDFERLEMQRQLATSLKAVVVLKGAYTSVATDTGVHFNSTGNPGMATGGTGDVLTGVLTALLAQNYLPHEAAITGVFLHGLAGDLGVEELGMVSLTAGDVIQYLPFAIEKVSMK